MKLIFYISLLFAVLFMACDGSSDPKHGEKTQDELDQEKLDQIENEVMENEAETELEDSTVWYHADPLGVN